MDGVQHQNRERQAQHRQHEIAQVEEVAVQVQREEAEGFNSAVEGLCKP